MYSNNLSNSTITKPPLAMVTIPIQPWEEPYAACKALEQGTIFPSLNLPFYVTGGESHE